MSKYNEYKAKAALLDRLLSAFTNDGLSVDTIRITHPKIPNMTVRIERERYRDGLFITISPVSGDGDV